MPIIRAYSAPASPRWPASDEIGSPRSRETRESAKENLRHRDGGFSSADPSFVARTKKPAARPLDRGAARFGAGGAAPDAGGHEPTSADVGSSIHPRRMPSARAYALIVE